MQYVLLIDSFDDSGVATGKFVWQLSNNSKVIAQGFF
jgi:hypothetical protein